MAASAALSRPHQPLIYLTSGIIAVLAGCASRPPDVPQIASAAATLSDAERAGANRDAPEELRDGRTTLNLAKEARDKGDQPSAEYSATESLADAKLALVTSQRVQADQAVASLRPDLDTPRKKPAASASASSASSN